MSKRKAEEDENVDENMDVNLDEDMDENDGEELRRKYRELLDEVSEKEEMISTQMTQESTGKTFVEKEDGVSETPEEDQVVDDELSTGLPIVRKLMGTANDLFANVRKPEDCLLDAKVVVQLSGLCRHQAQAMSTNTQKFKVGDFAEKLMNNMRGVLNPNTGIAEIPAKKFCNMGKGIQGLFSRVPYLTFLNGSIFDKEQELKVKKARPKSLDSSKLVKTEASKLKTAQKSENQTEILVNSTYKQLVDEYRARKKENVPYFNFVINPHSFSETVENIFHVSFLVKEKKIGMIMSDQGLPVIYPIKKSAAEALDDDQEKEKCHQLVTAFSIPSWKILIEALNITSPIIQHDKTLLMNNRSGTQ